MLKLWLTHKQSALGQAEIQPSRGEHHTHPRLRHLAPGYKRKKGLVRNIWLVSLLLMIPFSLGAKLALALATTFIGLIILDETE